MANNKKKLMTTIIAASMAAALVLGGGSYAYLQSQSGTVTNRFQTNQVMVSLSETGSTQYNIIPGVNDTKDPTVTLNNTIDAFVFVKISDKTEGVVGYTTADGWTEISELFDAASNTKVYYRKAAGGDTEKNLAVLKDNAVSYQAALTNDDMTPLEGKNITLTFEALAIQARPFVDPVTDAQTGETTTPTEKEAAINAYRAFAASPTPPEPQHTVTVTFHTDYGTVIEQTDSFTYGTETLSLLPMSEYFESRRPNFTIISWYDDAGNHYARNGEYNGADDVTLHAEWGYRQYTLTLDPNIENTTIQAVSSTFTAQNSPVLHLPDTFTREGYAMMSWNTKPDGSGTSYALDATYYKTGDVTLYAQWEEMNPTVSASYSCSYPNDHTVYSGDYPQMITMSATGGQPNYTYKFEYRKAGTDTWTLLQDYDTSAKLSMSYESLGRPAVNENYELRMTAKDQRGITSAPLTYTFTVSLKGRYELPPVP